MISAVESLEPAIRELLAELMIDVARETKFGMLEQWELLIGFGFRNFTRLWRSPALIPSNAAFERVALRKSPRAPCCDMRPFLSRPFGGIGGIPMFPQARERFCHPYVT